MQQSRPIHILCALAIPLLVQAYLAPSLCRAERRREHPCITIPAPDTAKPEAQSHSPVDEPSPTVDTSRPPADAPRPLGFYEYRFYKGFGATGLGQGHFQQPVDIGIDRDDNIYICEKEGGRIQTFDSEGNFEEEWEGLDIKNEKGLFNEPSSLDKPNALCVDYKERIGQTVIFVTDTKNDRVLQFDKEGALIDPEGKEIKEDNAWKRMKDDDLLWGGFGSRTGQFHTPTDIAVDNHDNCYVLDAENSRIQCFDDKGEFKLTWGGFGSGPGSFFKPTRLTYDPTGFGSIWVIDSKDNRFHQFDLDGDFLRSLIPKDQDKNPLPKPADFCVDSDGFVYVTDSSLNKVFKYNNDLEYVQCWGAPGSGPGQFKNPSGIIVDSERRVLIVDTGNNRIQIFQLF